eukprot:SAG25_NODE_454_length_7870_cov_2.720499_1_plen_100_part_00
MNTAQLCVTVIAMNPCIDPAGPPPLAAWRGPAAIAARCPERTTQPPLSACSWKTIDKRFLFFKIPYCPIGYSRSNISMISEFHDTHSTIVYTLYLARSS